MNKLNVSQYLLIHIIMPISIVIVIPLLFLLININRQFVEDYVATMSQTLEVIDHDIGEQLKRTTATYHLAQNLTEKVASNYDKWSILENFIMLNGEIASFFEVDEKGTILSSFPHQPLLNGTLLPHWQKTIPFEGNISITPPFKDDINGQIVMLMMPQKISRNNLVMTTHMDLNQYIEHVNDKNLKLFIYNGDQLLFDTTDDYLQEGIGLISGQYQYDIGGQLINLKETNFMGKPAVFEEIEMANYHWTLIGLTDKAIVFGNEQLTATIFLMIAVVIYVVFYIFMIDLKKQLIDPLKRIGDYFAIYNVKVSADKANEIISGSSLVELEALCDGIKLLNLQVDTTYQELYEFVSVAAHDLREPLRTITSYLEILRNDYLMDLPSEGQQYMEHIFMASKRSQHLIEALLAYATLNKGLVMETFEASECVNYVVRNLKAKIVEKNAQINIGPLPKLCADKSFFERLLQNLISNSLKYSHQNVLIEIYMEDQLLFFKDNGIGFDNQYAQLIFKPFKRLHASDEYHGTGIGLSIVAKIVESQQWQLAVFSEVGVGTVFSIDLGVSVIKD